MKNIMYSKTLNTVLMSSKILYSELKDDIEEGYYDWFRNIKKEFSLTQDDYDLGAEFVGSRPKVVYFITLDTACNIAALGNKELANDFKGVVAKRVKLEA